jgi:hypothetical protein
MPAVTPPGFRGERATSLAAFPGQSQNEPDYRPPYGEEQTMTDFTPHQQKIIKRYYDNQGTIQRQRLAELVTELYLAEGKKRKRLWEQTAAAMQKLGVPQARIDHLVRQADPALVAQVVKELETK